jgi:hypothetical protein
MSEESTDCCRECKGPVTKVDTRATFAGLHDLQYLVVARRREGAAIGGGPALASYDAAPTKADASPRTRRSLADNLPHFRAPLLKRRSLLIRERVPLINPDDASTAATGMP